MDAVQRLNRFLESKGWSTSDLARELGLSHTTISKIRSGKRSAGRDVAVRIQEITTGWAEGPIAVGEWRRAS